MGGISCATSDAASRQKASAPAGLPCAARRTASQGNPKGGRLLAGMRRREPKALGVTGDKPRSAPRPLPPAKIRSVTGQQTDQDRLRPAAPVAFVAGVADAALADQIDLSVPLTVAGADRAAPVEIAGARSRRDAVERVRIGRAGAVDDVGGVRQVRDVGRNECRFHPPHREAKRRTKGKQGRRFA